MTKVFNPIFVIFSGFFKCSLILQSLKFEYFGRQKVLDLFQDKANLVLHFLYQLLHLFLLDNLPFWVIA